MPRGKEKRDEGMYGDNVPKLRVRHEDDEGVFEGYKTFANKIVAQVTPKERGVAKNVLNSKNAKEMYKIFKEEDMPDKQIERFFKHGVDDLAQGKKISPRAYTMAVAEEMAQYGAYSEALYEMKQEGLLTSDQYREVLGTMKERVHKGSQRFASGLEVMAEKAAVWLFMAIGAILVLISGFTMTGAAIGTVFDITLLLVVGVALFIVGLILNFKNSK